MSLRQPLPYSLSAVKALQIPLLVLMAAITVYTMFVPDAANFPNHPEMARIMFFHVPCAILSQGFVLLAAWFGWKYLRTRDLVWDIRLAAAIELSALLAALGLATGILFSKMIWGDWWHWDPRQTSFLLVTLLIAGSVALRAGFTDELRRAQSCSAYAVAILIPCIFLTFIFPRIPAVKGMSFHPSTTIAEGQLDRSYSIGLWGVAALLTLAFAYVYRARVRAGQLELALVNQDGMDPIGGGDPARDGVVRPVALPEER